MESAFIVDKALCSSPRVAVNAPSPLEPSSARAVRSLASIIGFLVEREGPAMSVRGYVLIETEVGKAKSVGEAVLGLAHSDAKVLAVDTVTGPYDVIVQLEADDLDKLGNCITDGVQRVAGVQRTTTCLAVKLA
jgi:DNA-binding Lrp family transcriptional regulator